MTVPLDFDHVVIAGPNLPDLIDWFERETGVRAELGGRHPRGTANALVAFTQDGQRSQRYLELIGPDPERNDVDSVELSFGIESLTEPTVRTYALHPHDIDTVAATADAAGVSLGPVQPLSRATPDGAELHWRLTSAPRTDASVAYRPFLIDWGDTPHPGQTIGPTLEFTDLFVEAPDATAVARVQAAIGLSGDDVLRVEPGSTPRLHLTVTTAEGRSVTL